MLHHLLPILTAMAWRWRRYRRVRRRRELEAAGALAG